MLLPPMGLIAQRSDRQGDRCNKRLDFIHAHMLELPLDTGSLGKISGAVIRSRLVCYWLGSDGVLSIALQ